MAQALKLPEQWATSLAVAAALDAPADPAGLARLPAEWQAVDRVVLQDLVIDHVVVGPNGVFTIAVDPDPTPATITDGGLFRNGVRVTTTVKSALAGAYDLRRRVGSHLFAYPLLVTAVQVPGSSLDRLGVIPAGGVPEALWSHPGLPLTRSQRLEALWSLHSLAS